MRRAFATANAETLIPDALQALMRHKSYTVFIFSVGHLAIVVSSIGPEGFEPPTKGL